LACALNLIRVAGNSVYKKTQRLALLAFNNSLVFNHGHRRIFLLWRSAIPGSGTAFTYLYDYVYSPLMAMMFALLAFYVGSASYRAFRARTKEATVLLLAAFFVMLGRVPLGDALTGWLPNWLHLSNLSNWIMNIPNTPANARL
jgi:lipopolysaccharide export LptBFGC system permease protein LptF